VIRLPHPTDEAPSGAVGAEPATSATGDPVGVEPTGSATGEAVDVEPTRSTTGDADAPGVGPMHTDGRYETAGGRSVDALRRYVLVTKPRIIELLLVTTVPTMVVAAGGWPGTWLVVATVIGGTLSAGSANALNNELDRDIDRRMRRTQARPTATDAVPRGRALGLGLGLGVAGFVWLAAFVNVLAAALATFAILFYVFVYTLGLKRRTSQAVVIGGVAGSMPVLTGWAAVPDTSMTDPVPWLLFAIMFWWQPPHFWALAMKYRDDYARAGLPMLPVTHGNDETTRHILLYSYLLLAVVLLTIAGAGVGLLFTVPALTLTLGWLVLAHRLRSSRTVGDAMRLFAYSTVYLALLFVAVAVDAVV
jgi:heme o synthase